MWWSASFPPLWIIHSFGRSLISRISGHLQVSQSLWGVSQFKHHPPLIDCSKHGESSEVPFSLHSHYGLVTSSQLRKNHMKVEFPTSNVLSMQCTTSSCIAKFLGVLGQVLEKILTPTKCTANIFLQQCHILTSWNPPRGGIKFNGWGIQHPFECYDLTLWTHSPRCNLCNERLSHT